MTSIDVTATRLAAPFDTVSCARTPRAMTPIVHIVDLDGDARLLSDWVRTAGLSSRSYTVVDDFMDGQLADRPACLVIDCQFAGAQADPASFLKRLAGRCPIVVTAYGADISVAVVAMKTGAIDFVEKPLREGDILRAINEAIRIDHAQREAARRRAGLEARFATLSARERQVMALVTAGLLNKQVAGELGISEITVKAHRGAVMRKMGARSLPDLVRMADALADDE